MGAAVAAEDAAAVFKLVLPNHVEIELKFA